MAGFLSMAGSLLSLSLSLSQEPLEELEGGEALEG